VKLTLATITILVLLVSVTLAGNAFAEKNEIKSIMDTYKKIVQKAQSDFQTAIKKANSDARDAASKGIPTDEINTKSKAAIQDARNSLKSTIQKAKSDAKFALAQIKAATKP
jgi:DNA-binding NtrC family response regulator